MTSINQEKMTYDIPELNSIFRNLDSDTQQKILKYADKSVQSNILKVIGNSKAMEFYEALNEKDKAKLNELPIRDKYNIIQRLFNENNLKNQQNQKQLPPVLESVDTEKIEELLIENKQLEKEPLAKNSDPPQKRFNDLVKAFYSYNPYIASTKKSNELEVKFGTKGIKPLTRNDYDNVIRKLKSFGFVSSVNEGVYLLRVNCQFMDSKTGTVKLSDIRTEISGIHNIQEYCNNNDLKALYIKTPSCINFVNKRVAISTDKNNKFVMKYFPVDFKDFNFRVTYNTEEEVIYGIKNFTIDNWKKSKKIFRYLNRVSFRHPDYPVIVDISIVKYGNRGQDRYGRQGNGDMIPVYTLEESNVFNNNEVYEIEIEVDNSKIGPGTKFNTPELILESLRKVIKYVLGGLQGTNFPVSYIEQREVLDEYMKIIWKDEYDPNKRIGNQYFIGPNSITLQMVNISQPDENNSDVNIRTNFVVTDKADGDRHLLFISSKGKIYLINTNMDVIFTGAKTSNEICFNTIIDGELIAHNKKGSFINLYAAFDIYYYRKEDVRPYTFMLLEKEENMYKSRYYLLKSVLSELKPVSVIENKEKEPQTFTKLLEKINKGNNFISPIKIVAKEFFPMNNKQTIFDACDIILNKEKEGRFEYETDGLIFTHSYFGVGSNEISKAGPKNKITWDKSFKWKPPHYNTIDFLVTTDKNTTGEDKINSVFDDGVTLQSNEQFNEYKTLILRCGFSERKDGFINPCQDIIDDKLPQFNERYEDTPENDYLPKRFYPTEPYDINAGLCKMLLTTDSNGARQMFTEKNEVFGDNTIVEFRYDFEREDGWRWVPLRVRYDKTSRYLRNEKEYGNSYKTANENWKSIHPSGRITEEMLSSGLNIPDIYVSEDKYYNTPAGKFYTESLKNFHNLYVKKLLIKSVSKQDDTLIDYACGKAGDLSKWITAKLSFVYGIDLSRDNLENRLDGACARYLKARKTNKRMPYALFVNGNSAYNIRSGQALLNDKAKQINGAIFGKGSKDPENIGKGVARQYGKHEDGFNISSCQFALHYFLETPDTLKGFAQNLSECTKLNGYFIGTAYDGKLIFDMLKNTPLGESVQIIENGKKIWEVVKGYNAEIFADDSSCIGYRIDVYQESINQLITEYLVNFDYLDRVLNAYGFRLINKEEATELNLRDGSGMFSELYANMLDEINKNRFKSKDYGNAPNMKKYEQKISFLNRYFIYKKYMEVNVSKVVIDFEEYNEQSNINPPENQQEKITEEKITEEKTTKQNKKEKKEKTEKTEKPKVKKLNKKVTIMSTEMEDIAAEKETPIEAQIETPIEVPIEVQKETPIEVPTEAQKEKEVKLKKRTKSNKTIVEGESEESKTEKTKTKKNKKPPIKIIIEKDD